MCRQLKYLQHDIIIENVLLKRKQQPTTELIEILLAIRDFESTPTWTQSVIGNPKNKINAKQMKLNFILLLRVNISWIFGPSDESKNNSSFVLIDWLFL